IYRLAPKGSKYVVPKVELETVDSILTVSRSPNLAVRAMAYSRLKRAKPYDRLSVLIDAVAIAQDNRLISRLLRLVLDGPLSENQEQAGAKTEKIPGAFVGPQLAVAILFKIFEMTKVDNEFAVAVFRAMAENRQFAKAPSDLRIWNPDEVE